MFGRGGLKDQPANVDTNLIIILLNNDIKNTHLMTSTRVSRRLMITEAVGLVQAGCVLAAKILEILLVLVTTAA